MANLRLTNLAAYRAYFADIATKHKEVDGYKWGDKDVVKNDNLSDIPARILLATPYDNARYGDRMSDNIHKIKKARVAYLKTATTEAFSDIDTVFDECEAVIEQIIAKIYKDKRGEDVAGVWTMIATDINSWKTGPVEMI